MPLLASVIVATILARNFTWSAVAKKKYHTWSTFSLRVTKKRKREQVRRRKILNLVWDKKCNTKNKPNVSIAKKSGSALRSLSKRERGGPFVDWPQTHACCNFSAFFPAEKKPKRNKRQQHQRHVAAIPLFAKVVYQVGVLAAVKVTWRRKTENTKKSYSVCCHVRDRWRWRDM